MEQHTLENVNNCWNTNISFYLETSGGHNSNLYLNVVHFFNYGVYYICGSSRQLFSCIDVYFVLFYQIKFISNDYFQNTETLQIFTINIKREGILQKLLQDIEERCFNLALQSVSMRLCQPPDGNTSPKYKLLFFITTKFFLQREECTSF